jgi:Uma2 family endonuclease
MGFALAKERLLTVEEYLLFEEKSKIRHEYIDGEVFAMAGSKRNHSLIASNIGTELAIQLRIRNCEVHFGDLRVEASETTYLYPDVTVVCGDIKLVPNIFDTLKNPTLICEVLSKSTEARDRGDKSSAYRRLESLTDYVLISQNKIQVEHYIRQSDDTWKLIEHTESNAKMFFELINCELTLAEIYRRVEFPQLKLVRPKKDKNGK